jgi:hypothetical protein
VDRKWIYRFPKEEKSLDLLEREKKVLDVLNKYINIKIPKLEII